MTYKLTIFPFEPINLINGYNSINIENFPLFWKIIRGFKQETKDDLVLSENNRVLDLSKYLIYVGELTSCTTPKQIFYKQMLKKLENTISDDSKHNLYILDREMRKIITKEIFDFGLPLEISDDWSLNDIIGMMDISYCFHQNNEPLNILGEFIDLSFYLTNTKILLFTNLNRYLSKEQLQKIVYESKSKKVTILSVNLSSDMEDIEADENGCFIDNDFTMFKNR
ncbi:type II-A CRISPR-associated protein Csn2 [Xylocopilactobacillus apicola]|uniref:Type II-A CRISPR-associated protein Csn2 n=1 Tax=Xylocopilactobacillus apicola TaxID=2932184 RepID=A0AAU9D7F6_9LACO|nr:type II-A CRISPR-associated protein Csn2 [Xylocopilactobacillus apicola]BDR58250.1 hypothetical protein XA3_06910 [Xylocopilactobacillus apicola]